MTFQIQKATKKQAKLRLGLIGPSGSGKTFTALNIAKSLGGKTCVIDSENGSASKYADLFDFDVIELRSFSPKTYVEALEAIEAAKYDNAIIDSLSHAWIGKDGALEQVDKIAKRTQSGNTFTAWRDVTPLHNELVNKLTAVGTNLIVTIRSKMEYVLEENEKGKKVPRKVGMQPVQRDGLEYEFDVVADLDLDNNFIVSKTRCPKLAGYMANKAGVKEAKILKSWLTDGVQEPSATVAASASHGQSKNGSASSQNEHIEEAKVVEEKTAEQHTDMFEDCLKELQTAVSIDHLKDAFISFKKLHWRPDELAVLVAAKDTRKKELQEGF